MAAPWRSRHGHGRPNAKKISDRDVTVAAFNRRSSVRTTIRISLSLLALALLLGPATADADSKAAKGEWKKKTYDVSGSWEIVRESGVRYLQFSSDFKTKSGPDLKVFLSPKSLRDLKSSNATNGSLRLGVLAKHEGKQRISIAEDVDLAKYGSVAIHCEKYSVLFAASALK